MTILNIQPFGDIKLDAVSDYYEAVQEVSGREVRFDLNFENDAVDAVILDNVQHFISHVSTYQSAVFDYLKYPLNHNQGALKGYFDHHLLELSDEQKVSLFDTKNVGIDRFIAALSLRRIGLYPESQDTFSVFDIALPENTTNYILAVYTNSEGEISYISIES